MWQFPKNFTWRVSISIQFKILVHIYTNFAYNYNFVQNHSNFLLWKLFIIVWCIVIPTTKPYISFNSLKHITNTEVTTRIEVHLINICDQICKKDLIHTQFHDTLFIAISYLCTSMHQQHVCLLLLKVEQFAFTQAFVSSLSGIHECSGSL